MYYEITYAYKYRNIEIYSDFIRGAFIRGDLPVSEGRLQDRWRETFYMTMRNDFKLRVGSEWILRKKLLL